MSDVEKIVLMTTLYECKVCKKRYDSKDKAERCADPVEPAYEIGQWAMANRWMMMAVPGGDEFSREYEDIHEGDIGRISCVCNENEFLGLDKPHPEYMYQFDKGDSPLIWYTLRESNLDAIDDKGIERLKERYAKASKEADGLGDMLDALGGKNERSR